MDACRVGIIGLGTVGQGVAGLLRRHAGLYESRAGRRVEIVCALVRDPSKPREIGVPEGAPVTADEDAFFGVESDVIVEVAGGVEPAFGRVVRALESGRDVVTANKALLAARGEEVFTLGERLGRRVLFEAAVAGGVPVVRLVTEGLRSCAVVGFEGILNGTCNFILSRMERGGDYASALKEAQRLGYAEADPALDVSGRDSLEKLAILATLAFGAPVRPEQATSEGIERLTAEDIESARRGGRVIRMLACAERTDRGELLLWNGPTLLEGSSPLARVGGADMALLVRTDEMRETFISGDGAGRYPTASAVVSDLLEAARPRSAGAPSGGQSPWPTGAPAARVRPMAETITTGRRGVLIRSLER